MVKKDEKMAVIKALGKIKHQADVWKQFRIAGSFVYTTMKLGYYGSSAVLVPL